MRRLTLTLFALSFLFCAFAQDNPYELFGHKTDVVYKTPLSDYLYIINTDTTSNIHAMVFIAEKSVAMFLSKQDSIVGYVKIEPNELFRWLSVDPMASERSWVSPYNFDSHDFQVHLQP